MCIASPAYPFAHALGGGYRIGVADEKLFGTIGVGGIVPGRVFFVSFLFYLEPCLPCYGDFHFSG